MYISSLTARIPEAIHPYAKLNIEGSDAISMFCIRRYEDFAMYTLLGAATVPMKVSILSPCLHQRFPSPAVQFNAAPGARIKVIG